MLEEVDPPLTLERQHPHSMLGEGVGPLMLNFMVWWGLPPQFDTPHLTASNRRHSHAAVTIRLYLSHCPTTSVEYNKLIITELLFVKIYFDNGNKGI